MLSGQKEFMEALYRAHFPSLIMYAKIMVNDEDIAQDIVQDTFHTALLHIDKLIVHENPGGWLMNTLKNKIREHRRTRRRRIDPILSLDSDFSLDTFLPGAFINQEPEDIVSMEQVQKELTPDEFQLIKRYVFDGASHLEIAKELNITVYASQKRLQRIREKLYKAFPERKSRKKKIL